MQSEVVYLVAKTACLSLCVWVDRRWVVWSSSWSSSWTSRTTAWPPRVQAFMEKLREGIGEMGCMVSMGYAHRGMMV